MRTTFLTILGAAAITLGGCGASASRKQASAAAQPAAEAVVEQPAAAPAESPAKTTKPAVVAKPSPVAVVTVTRRTEPETPARPSASDRKVARLLEAHAVEVAEMLDDGPESIPQIAEEERNRRSRLASLQELDEDDRLVALAVEYLEAQASAMAAEKDLLATVLAVAVTVKKAEAAELPAAQVVEAILPELRKGLLGFSRAFDNVLPIERRVVRLAKIRGVEVEPVFAQNRAWRDKLGQAADQAATLQVLQQLMGGE